MKKLLLILFITIANFCFSQEQIIKDSVSISGKKYKTHKDGSAFFIIKNNGDTIYEVIEKLPQFNNGNETLEHYLMKNLTYPSEAKLQGIQGKVFVNFVIDKTGAVTETNIVKGVHELLDNEALKIVNSFPNWSPGIQKGKPVSVSYNLPLNFKLRGYSNHSGVPPLSSKYYKKGIKLMEKEKYNEAIKSFSEAIKWHPKYKEAYIKRAIAYHKTNQIDKACKDWRISFQLGEKESQESLDKYCK
ncbi:MAG: TonB family protein [Vicingaceae bacterium]